MSGGPPPAHDTSAGRASRAGATAVTAVKWAFIATAIAVVGIVSLSYLLGFRLVVVTGGSMVPRFRPGDAVLVKASGADGVRVGDVVIFRHSSGNGMTTHRVVGIRVIDGKTWYQTKGDANQTTDADLTPTTAVYGRQLLTLRGAGSFLLRATSPKGKLALLGVPVTILMGQETMVLLSLRKRRRSSVEPAADDQTTAIPAEAEPAALTCATSALEDRIAARASQMADIRAHAARNQREMERMAAEIADRLALDPVG